MRTASGVASIVGLDLRAIRRDHVAVGTIALSLLGTAVITVLGAFQDHLPGWSAWFPFMVAVSLVGAPAGFAFPFGSLMVEERETRVGDALAVTPVRPPMFMAVRTSLATAWMAVWPLTSIHVMNATWRAVDLPVTHWLAVLVPLTLLTPAFALLVPILAEDQLGALAVLKGLSLLCLVPLALFFVPEGAWFRLPLLVSPTAWVLHAFLAFLERLPASGYGWALGGIVYAAILLAAVVSLCRRRVYGLGA